MVVGQSKLEYYIVLGYSILFRYFGLLCLLYLYLVFTLFRLSAIQNPFLLIVAGLALTETLWYFLFSLPYRHRLQKTGPESAIHPPALTREQRAAFFRKCLGLVPDVEQYVRKWAQDGHWDDIRRENIKDWLLWALFDRGGEPGDDDEELESYIAEAEKLMGFEIRRGRGDVEAIRLSLDPINMTHRSLLYYTVFGFIDLFTTLVLYILGFRFYRQHRLKFFTTFPFRPLGLLGLNESAGSPHLSYFARAHRSPTKRPILFIHGVGVGLFPYLPFLRQIPRDVGVVLLELHPISARISSPMPRAPELVSSIASILAQQGPEYNDMVVVAHSYGTFLTTPLLLSPAIAPKINSLVLVDPVALLLHLPDVAFNFTRRRARYSRGNHLQMQLVATDPGVAHTLARRFSWREHILWRELLTSDTDPLRTTVIVGERDCVLDASAIASYVEFGHPGHDSPQDRKSWEASEKWWVGSRQLEIIWLPGMDHGNALLRRKSLGHVNRVIARYCVKEDVADTPVRRPVGPVGATLARRDTGGSVKSLY